MRGCVYVHSQAVLVPLVVLTLLTRQDGRAAELFMSMSVAGVFGLFPLLPDVGELGVKSESVRFRDWRDMQSLKLDNVAVDTCSY